jgi:hypothetical protein
LTFSFALSIFPEINWKVNCSCDWSIGSLERIRPSILYKIFKANEVHQVSDWDNSPKLCIGLLFAFKSVNNRTLKKERGELGVRLE